MDIPPVLKKTPVLIGAGVVVLIIILAAKKSTSTTSSSGGSDAGAIAATQSANIQIAGINADIQKATIAANRDVTLGSYSKDVNLANVGAQERVALTKLTTDENVNLQNLDYSHDIANRQLENNRVLGLTAEDTKRLISTQENQTRLTLGITAIDANRFIAERTIHSDEVKQARQLETDRYAIDSNERITDWTTSRALTFAQISGANQVAAVKAAKPSWFQTFMGGLGGVTSLAKVFVG